MAKEWIVLEKISDDLVRQILFYRGAKTDEETEKFLNPDYEKHLHDPFLILGMEKAVERILLAIKNNERVVVFGDYDADGVSASAIFYHFFKKIGFENFHFHIPDRNLEGYGLTLESIDEFAGQNAKLIITVDCGITDVKEVDKANAAGIDVIITDHHLPLSSSASKQEKLPNAFAIINSKQENDNYPFKFLSGAGVAFKVVQALARKGSAQGGQGFKIVPGWEKWLLDLVGIATIADMVPLVDENRVLAYYGLQVLKKTRRVGLISFFRRLDMNPQNVNEDDISFMIAPRINISSRMDHANASFDLLTTESQEEADWITGNMEVFNSERKKIVEKILGEVEGRVGKEPPSVIVQGDLSWNPGVIGLVAGKLKDIYGRSVFIWSKGEGNKIKGSCRGDGSFNLVELMKLAPEDVLVEAGGHAMAGGFSVNEEKIADLEKEILAAYEKVEKKEIQEALLIDKELDIDEINWDLWDKIEKLAPFGAENPKPVFVFSNLEIANVRKFGNGGLHLQLDFKKSSANGGGSIVPAIGFFASDENLNLLAGQKIDLVATIEKSFFRATPELRLRIVDIRIK